MVEAGGGGDGDGGGGEGGGGEGTGLLQGVHLMSSLEVVFRFWSANASARGAVRESNMMKQHMLVLWIVPIFFVQQDEHNERDPRNSVIIS